MLHDALRLIRVFHNQKQGVLAKRLGISQSHLSEVESGAKQPTVELLEKYGEVFNMPVSSIMYFSEKKGIRSASEKLSDAIASKAIKMLDWVESITSDDRKPKHP
jgi:transcriptional regulator with XRE-family HTH domain